MLESRLAQVADDACELLEQRGWQIGPSKIKGDGPICLGMAIWAVTEPDHDLCQKAMGAALRMAGCVVIEGMLHSHLYAWNDSPGRSVEDVFLVLKKMALGSWA